MTTKLKLMLAGSAVCALAASVAIAQSTGTPPASTPAPAAAPSLLSLALSDGSVGEMFDGRLGIRTATPSPALQKEVDSLNIKRRLAYTELAGDRGKTIQQVAYAVGCETLSTRVAVGRAYMLEDKIWRVRKAGETIKLPTYCGNE